MKKPQTFNEFKEVINKMEHRERFIFDMGECMHMEIYFTYKWETRRADGNFLFTLYSQGSIHSTLNKLQRLTTDKILMQIYESFI